MPRGCSQPRPGRQPGFCPPAAEQAADWPGMHKEHCVCLCANAHNPVQHPPDSRQINKSAAPRLSQAMPNTSCRQAIRLHLGRLLQACSEQLAQLVQRFWAVQAGCALHLLHGGQGCPCLPSLQAVQKLRVMTRRQLHIRGAVHGHLLPAAGQNRYVIRLPGIWGQRFVCAACKCS